MAFTEKNKKPYKTTFLDYDSEEKPRKSERIANLPSDTALESNKERQDAEMKSGLAKVGKALLPGGGGMLVAEEILKRRKKDEGETASGLPREARGKVKRFQVPEHLRSEENKPLLERFKSGGSVSARADGCAVRGKTRGKMV